MDTRSVAQQAGALGMMPSDYVKNVLVSSSISPLIVTKISSTVLVYEAAFLRALLYESLLFLLRSMSHLVAYEVAAAKNQFSWAAVTLYYANYFSVLSMNRVAGEAISTTPVGATYKVTLKTSPALFDIQNVEVNNHKAVWLANCRLYQTFNWRDSSLDGIIVKIPLLLFPVNAPLMRPFVERLEVVAPLFVGDALSPP